MKRNMGNTDKTIRFILAAVFAALYFTGTVTGIGASILLILAVVFVLTSLVGLCPLYSMIGISTCTVERNKS